MKKNQISGKMLEFGKTIFDNTFTYMSTLQAQNEKIALRFLEKLPWVPEEGEKAFSQYVISYKKMLEDYKSKADENYEKVSEYFIPAEKSDKHSRARNVNDVRH
jgi:hypothetical protein